jgi:GxxExxY protein
MAAHIKRMIEEVALHARRIHGSQATRWAYQQALAAELRAAGIPFREDVAFSERYDDVEITHTLDLLVRGHLGVELRSEAEQLRRDHSKSLLRFYLKKAGLNRGVVLDFSGAKLKVIAVSVSENLSLIG